MAQPVAARRAERTDLSLFHSGCVQLGQLCARSLLSEFTPGLQRAAWCQETHRCKLNQYTWLLVVGRVSVEGFALRSLGRLSTGWGHAASAPPPAQLWLPLIKAGGTQGNAGCPALGRGFGFGCPSLPRGDTKQEPERRLEERSPTSPLSDLFCCSALFTGTQA